MAKAKSSQSGLGKDIYATPGGLDAKVSEALRDSLETDQVEPTEACPVKAHKQMAGQD